MCTSCQNHFFFSLIASRTVEVQLIPKISKARQFLTTLTIHLHGQFRPPLLTTDRQLHLRLFGSHQLFSASFQRVVLVCNPFWKNITENKIVEKIFRKVTQLGEQLVSLATRESLTTMVILQSPLTLATRVKKMVRFAFFQPFNSLHK